MASTNKTTNYNLSQFVGTDKPAWLSDYNQDMTKIDTGIHNAATTATGADGKADANTTAIGTLSSLNTEVKTDLVSAINEVDTNADTAQGTANQANGTALAASAGVTNLQNYFTITQTGTCPVTANGATVVTSADDLKYATNAAGTLGKLYGRMVFNTTAANITFTFPTGFRPTSQINIDGIVMWFDQTAGTQTMLPVTVATNGNCTISMTGYTANRTVRILIPACLLFLQDFGD